MGAELAARGVFCGDRSAFAEATRHLLPLGHVDFSYIVADLVLHLIAAPAHDFAAPDQHWLPARLVTRHSTAPPRMPQPAGKR